MEKINCKFRQAEYKAIFSKILSDGDWYEKRNISLVDIRIDFV